MPRVVKVAVIGSGLAGLTAAYLLSKANEDQSSVHFEVHLFEKSSTLGIDAHSISLNVPSELGSSEKEEEWRVDVPMRSFQGGYYPQLIALYKSLGVAFCARDFSYSFSRVSHDSSDARAVNTTMIYDGASGRAGISMPAREHAPSITVAHCALPIRLCVRAYVYGAFLASMALVALLFLRIVFLSIPHPRIRGRAVEDMTFGEWAARATPRGRLARWTGLDTQWACFARDVLLPLFSAVCTAPEEAVWAHPAEEFLDYVWLTFGTHHYVATHGVRDVATRLARGLEHVHLAAPITSLVPEGPNGELTLRCPNATYTGFAHIVLATPPAAAAALVQGYAEAAPSLSDVQNQAWVLRRFASVHTLVVNHTDASVLPSTAGDVRDLNLIHPHGGTEAGPLCLPPTYTMATQVVARPSARAPHVYQSTNPTVPIAPETVLSAARLERALLTQDAKRARTLLCEPVRSPWVCAAVAPTRLGVVQGAGGVWLCGAYAHVGVPLLEGCVASARNVVERGVLAREGVRIKKAPW